MRRRKAPDTRRRVQLITERLPIGSSILDTGSGHGAFIADAARRGYVVQGLEPSSVLRRVSRSISDVPVVAADLYNLPEDLGPFDGITLFHVLEHLRNPVQALVALRSRLHPRGLLFIEVPNCADLLLEASPAYREFYWQRAHLTYFDRATLAMMLGKAGIKDVDIRGVQRYGIENLMNWMVLGKPQLQSPSFETSGRYRWLEELYKARLEEGFRCDSLVAVARM